MPQKQLEKKGPATDTTSTTSVVFKPKLEHFPLIFKDIFEHHADQNKGYLKIPAIYRDIFKNKTITLIWKCRDPENFNAILLPYCIDDIPTPDLLSIFSPLEITDLYPHLENFSVDNQNRLRLGTNYQTLDITFLGKGYFLELILTKNVQNIPPVSEEAISKIFSILLLTAHKINDLLVPAPQPIPDETDSNTTKQRKQRKRRRSPRKSQKT